MANRIIGNIYLLDSGNIDLVWPSRTCVNAVAFYGVASNAELVLTYAANTDFSIFSFADNDPSNRPWSQQFHLGGMAINEQVRVQTLTAGTGFIYFK